jgi:hypothetical protein
MGTKGKFTVELETENAAAWMATNNTFAWNKLKDPGARLRLWNGVLIQLGQYTMWEDKKETVGFGKMEFLRSGEVVSTIQAKDFASQNKRTWINIVVKNPTSVIEDPMDRPQLGKLHINDLGRKLDRHLTPISGCITFWSENGYDLKVDENPNHQPHKRYTFTTSKDDDEYDVQIYTNGAEQPENPLEFNGAPLKDFMGKPIPGFNGLRICEGHHLYHGSHNSPPNDP